MEKLERVDLINKIIIAQGEIQRVIIWLSRLHEDLQQLLKEAVKDEKS